MMKESQKVSPHVFNIKELWYAIEDYANASFKLGKAEQKCFDVLKRKSWELDGDEYDNLDFDKKRLVDLAEKSTDIRNEKWNYLLEMFTKMTQVRPILISEDELKGDFYEFLTKRSR